MDGRTGRASRWGAMRARSCVKITQNLTEAHLRQLLRALILPRTLRFLGRWIEILRRYVAASGEEVSAELPRQPLRTPPRCASRQEHGCSTNEGWAFLTSLSHHLTRPALPNSLARSPHPPASSAHLPLRKPASSLAEDEPRPAERKNGLYLWPYGLRFFKTRFDFDLYF